MAEGAEAKGRRLLTEGRLIVMSVTASGRVVATCRGDSGEVYDLGYDERRGQWRCTCPARSKCAHLVALQLVTVRGGEHGDTRSG